MDNEIKAVADRISSALEVAKSIARTSLEITISDAECIVDNVSLGEVDDVLADRVVKLTGELEIAKETIASLQNLIESLESDLETANCECDGHAERVARRDATISSLEEDLAKERAGTTE